MRKTIEMNSVSWNCLCLCVCLMGVAWALPSQISSDERNREVELPDELSLEPTGNEKFIFDATSESSTSERTSAIANSEDNLQTSTAKSTATSEGKDSTTMTTTELSEEAKDRVQCLADWDKFLSDFGKRYTSDIETEKRRNVFCDNWQTTKNHNKQFELGLVSYDIGINQFSDLTFEEWRMKQQPHHTLIDQDIQ